MIVLGLSHLEPAEIAHDVTTALIIDGKINLSVSEDRFTGIKHHKGYPASSIKFCLANDGLRLDDVDKVTVGYGLDNNKIDIERKSKFFSYAKNDTFFRKTPIEKQDPVFYDHEYIHAKTGYFLSGFEKAVVIVLDGAGTDNGQRVSGGIFIINKGETEIIRMYSTQASLGWTYGTFTELCGFMINDGEGKTMSLASFSDNDSESKKKEVYEKISKFFPQFQGIDYIEGGTGLPLKWKNMHNFVTAKMIEPKFVNLLSSYKKEQIAWAAQKALETQIIEIVKGAVELTGIKNIVLSGGIFLNVIANMRLREELEKMNCHYFFNPICGDIGNAIGSALEYCYEITGNSVKLPWQSLSLGPSFENEQIKIIIDKMNLKFSKVEKVSTAIDLIEKGKIVGWFQGSAELGPRGLGNRSILSKADNAEFKDKINFKVKHREGWRPFCPTITFEQSSHYLENSTYAPYMILGFKAKNIDEIPAVIHVDKTTRPQTLKRTDNREYYDVVDGLGGIILNTSLNLAGDPMNALPADALLTLKNSQLDALIIEDYLVERK